MYNMTTKRPIGTAMMIAALNPSIIFHVQIVKKQNPRILLYQYSWVFSLGKIHPKINFLDSPMILLLHLLKPFRQDVHKQH